MPTPSERRALLFLSGLIVLGAGVRTTATLRGASLPPDGADSTALAHQLQAVDSARHAASSSRKQKATPRTSKSRTAKGAKPPATRGSLRSGSAMSSTERSAAPSIYYYEESDSEPERTPAAKGLHIDLDVAPAADIERLPRIGPVLARRIVANRDSLGPFGSLDEFQRVRGVGPALARVVKPYVTFSMQPRPSPVDRGTGRGRKGARRQPPRGTRAP